jgi:glutaconate CoA-transferase subunit B
MPSAPRDVRDEELLADVIARLIGDVRHVAVGNASPIPATAALLARERNGNGRPYVSLLQSRKHNFFTDGARELFDCAGQGRIDVFFLSGGEIDGAGNVNLVSIGDHDHPKVRFPGSFGSAYLYYVVPKVILFRTEHSRRTLVPKVSFISAPGVSEPNVYRPAGRSRWSPIAACSRSPMGDSRWRASILATLSMKWSRTLASSLRCPHASRRPNRPRPRLLR